MNANVGKRQRKRAMIWEVPGSSFSFAMTWLGDLAQAIHSQPLHLQYEENTGLP